MGCDGAHSAVRKGLGLSFAGDAFVEQYMLGDVEVDWKLPAGFGIRSMHVTDDGRTDDVLVCIPLPGHGRYRMSMLAPPELVAAASSEADPVAHGFEGVRRPELPHIQAVLDRLAPEPATARTCAGRRSSGSATGSWTATATAGSSSPGTPRTSIRPPARRE